MAAIDIYVSVGKGVPLAGKSCAGAVLSKAAATLRGLSGKRFLAIAHHQRSRQGRPGRQFARSPIASAGRALLDRMQRSLYEAQHNNVWAQVQASPSHKL